MADPDTVTMGAYARMRGVTDAAILIAIREGRLPSHDGRIRVTEADATWFRAHQQRADQAKTMAETEARRERAVLTSTAAKIAMTRRQVEQIRAGYTERDAAQARDGAIVARLDEVLPTLPAQIEGDGETIWGHMVSLLEEDLGDLQIEALRVTRDG